MDIWKEITMEGFNVKDKSLLENKEFLQELMERMMLVHTFEERAFWLFGNLQKMITCWLHTVDMDRRLEKVLM